MKNIGWLALAALVAGYVAARARQEQNKAAAEVWAEATDQV